jgi:signal transduction histidine kinase
VERDQALWVLAATVLHELNNPLHALGLILEELSLAGDESTRANLIERARAQSERTLSHLRMLRSLQSTEEPEFQVIALDRVVRTLADDVCALAAEDGLVVEVRSAGPLAANGDPTYIRTIVENLVDNSLQSLRGTGRGAIVIDLAREGSRAVVRVSDDGPPLACIDDDALFAPLRSTKTQGLGLGLPIARALARAMRGDLVLDDAAKKTFRLELPLGGPA